MINTFYEKQALLLSITYNDTIKDFHYYICLHKSSAPMQLGIKSNVVIVSANIVLNFSITVGIMLLKATAFHEMYF